MRVYTSKGFQNIPDQGGVQAPSMGGPSGGGIEGLLGNTGGGVAGGGQDLNKLFAMMMLSNPKRTSTYKSVYDLLKPDESLKPTEGQRNTLSGFAKAKSLVGKFATELDEIGLEENPFEARYTGATAGLLGKLGLGGRKGERVNVFKRLRKGFRVQMARALGEVGNLSLPEQQAALELIPDIGMSKFEVQENLRLMQEIIDDAAARSMPGGSSSVADTGGEWE